MPGSIQGWLNQSLWEWDLECSCLVRAFWAMLACSQGWEHTMDPNIPYRCSSEVANASL